MAACGKNIYKWSPGQRLAASVRYQSNICHEHSQSRGINKWIYKVVDSIRDSCPVTMLTGLSNPFCSHTCPYNDPLEHTHRAQLVLVLCVSMCVCIKERESQSGTS